ncbi:DUF6364 family protein [Ekhidna sp.]|uniref:DUF6364 family protein n=1 Tax=Ekhidna sp. TaxID=2608089 RepID=UPI003CCBDDA1
MKNVTLAISDELLLKARAYAKKHGTSVNEMIREFLQKRVDPKEEKFIDKLTDIRKDLKVDTKVKYKREDLYER